jgi:hypothetical protein
LCRDKRSWRWRYIVGGFGTDRNFHVIDFISKIGQSEQQIELPVIIVEDTKIQRIFGLAVDNLLIIRWLATYSVSSKSQLISSLFIER